MAPTVDEGSEDIISGEGMYAKATVSHGRQRVKCAILCDTGAESNYASIALLRKMGRAAPRVRPLNDRYSASSCTGSGLNIIGVAKLSVQIGSKVRWMEFRITTNLVLSAIIGRIELRRWGCGTPDFT